MKTSSMIVFLPANRGRREETEAIVIGGISTEGIDRGKLRYRILDMNLNVIAVSENEDKNCRTILFNHLCEIGYVQGVDQ